MLRIGEFSLSQIQQFLSTQNPAIRITQLSAQKQLLKEKIKESRLILHELEEHLDKFKRTGNIMRYQNRYPITLKQTLKQTEDLPVISARQQMSVEQFGYYCGKLMERVARDHIAIAGHMMALYHDRQFDPEQADIEIAVPALTAQLFSAAFMFDSVPVCGGILHCQKLFPFASCDPRYLPKT